MYRGVRFWWVLFLSITSSESEWIWHCLDSNEKFWQILRWGNVATNPTYQVTKYWYSTSKTLEYNHSTDIHIYMHIYIHISLCVYHIKVYYLKTTKSQKKVGFRRALPTPFFDWPMFGRQILTVQVIPIHVMDRYRTAISCWHYPSSKELNKH